MAIHAIGSRADVKCPKVVEGPKTDQWTVNVTSTWKKMSCKWYPPANNDMDSVYEVSVSGVKIASIGSTTTRLQVISTDVHSNEYSDDCILGSPAPIGGHCLIDKPTLSRSNIMAIQLSMIDWITPPPNMLITIQKLASPTCDHSLTLTPKTGYKVYLDMATASFMNSHCTYKISSSDGSQVEWQALDGGCVINSATTHVTLDQMNKCPKPAPTTCSAATTVVKGESGSLLLDIVRTNASILDSFVFEASTSGTFVTKMHTCSACTGSASIFLTVASLLLIMIAH